MDIFNEVKRDNIIGVKELAEEIEDISSVRNENGDSLLRFAVKHGASLAMFKLLVAAGADLFEVDEEGVSIMDDAIKKGRIDIVEYMVQMGMDPNSTSRKSGFTPLMAAVSFGDEKITRFLLSCGVDIHVKDNFNYSAKDYARMTGYKRFVKILEEYEEKS